jgi:hypothetical protein
MMKTFTLGEVLTVTTKKLLAPQGVRGMYTVVEYMTGGPVLTHELPDAFATCTPTILAKYPQLADVDATGLSYETYAPWMQQQLLRFGNEFELPTLEDGVWQTPPLPENTMVINVG